jgi:hypothetical protein
MSRGAADRREKGFVRWPAWLLLSLLVGACVSVLLGQDANWDLRNYHLYNPFALLNGRFGVDLMPAGMQTNFNALLDLPYYLLARGPLAGLPRLMAAAAGLPFGLLLFATLGLARWVLQPADAAGAALAVIAVAIGGTAAATVSEIGTTFNDISCAVLLVGALALGGPDCTERRPGWRVAAAGAMAGAAVALKLTNAVLAPGVLAGLLVAAPGWRVRWGVLWRFAVAAAAVGLALGGPLALALESRHGNPVFPLLNGLFRSPWYPPVDFYDTRFLPRSSLQAWFYPFWWVRRNASLVTESGNPFRDARGALAMLALPILAVGLVKADAARRRRVGALIVATVVAYLGWLRVFSILRYAVALEAFAAVLIVTAAGDLAALVSRRRVAAPVLAALLLAGLLRHTQPPDWWRIPYGRRVWDIETVRLPPSSLVVAVNAPVALVIPFIDSPGFRAVGFSPTTVEAHGWRLYEETMRIIREHPGPVFALAPDYHSLPGVWPEAGVVFDTARCRPIHTNIVFNAAVELCPGERISPGPPGSAPAAGR